MRRSRLGPRLLAVILPVSLLQAAPAISNAADADLIHSDSPLWRDGAQVWPKHFADDRSFGCAHRMKLGLWRFSSRDRGPESWFGFSNYGAVHCWMNVAEGYSAERLGQPRPGFLVDLGRWGLTELWALQIGARPGSDYILLSRQIGAGEIASFNVLQRQCPEAQVRGGPPLDILLTRYCGINSKPELIAMAKRMVMRPPLGDLKFERALPD